MHKFIHDLKTGDIVSAYGGTFKLVEDARESNAHRPQSAHLKTAPGPSDCAVAKAICLTGCTPGYFHPGSEWTFQGNRKAGRVTVLDNC